MNLILFTNMENKKFTVMSYKEFENILEREFEELFESGVVPYLEIHSGWYPLVYTACHHLSEAIAILDVNKEERPTVSTIKEKFGGLRIYLTYETERLGQITGIIESQSFHVCEFCGAMGEIKNLGHIQTLCQECYEKEKCRLNKTKTKKKKKKSGSS